MKLLLSLSFFCLRMKSNVGVSSPLKGKKQKPPPQDKPPTVGTKFRQQAGW